MYFLCEPFANFAQLRVKAFNTHSIKNRKVNLTIDCFLKYLLLHLYLFGKCSIGSLDPDKVNTVVKTR